MIFSFSGHLQQELLDYFYSKIDFLAFFENIADSRDFVKNA
jgi:hypothetical protein